MPTTISAHLAKIIHDGSAGLPPQAFISKLSEALEYSTNGLSPEELGTLRLLLDIHLASDPHPQDTLTTSDIPF